MRKKLDKERIKPPEKQNWKIKAKLVWQDTKRITKEEASSRRITSGNYAVFENGVVTNIPSDFKDAKMEDMIHMLL